MENSIELSITHWTTLAEHARKHGYGSRNRLKRLAMAAMQARKLQALYTLQNGKRTLYREQDLLTLLT